MEEKVCKVCHNNPIYVGKKNLFHEMFYGQRFNKPTMRMRITEEFRFICKCGKEYGTFTWVHHPYPFDEVLN